MKPPALNLPPPTRVLIVDDERSIRRALGEILGAEGCEVAEAEDAETALRFLGEHPFEVVVSDIILPRVNGVEFLNRLRAVAPRVEVVMMTGEPTVETAAAALRAGAADYLFKPVGKAEILRAVERAARLKQLEDSRRRLESENQAHRENLERLVRERTAQLRASEDKFRTLVETAFDWVWEFDAAGRYTYSSPRLVDLLGYRPEEVLGRTPFDLMPEAEAQRMRTACGPIVARREPFVLLEGTYRHRDGRAVVVETSGQPVFGPDGAFLGYRGMGRDLTERKRTQAMLWRAQRVESIGSLASGIAHDLNNILTPIIMCAPLLRSDEAPEVRQELTQTIEVSAHRAVGIVKQLLGFARGRESQKQSVQVRHLVREMAKIARETFPRSLRIEESCAADLWPVQADATQLNQVILNLCVNARDAMPDGGRLRLLADNVTLDESFVARHPEATAGPHIRLRVEDTGTGIPEEIQAHIFESFFTTKDEGQGTGLGLTTALGIVRNHQGFITFTSAVGRGTTFEVYLPAVPEANPSASDPKAAEAVRRGQGELILVVDDEPAICETTRRTLEHHGYRVVEAGDGIEGLARFSRQPTDIHAVVTDYMMPGMDGVTLCRALRALSPRLPLVVSSGGLFGKAGTHALRAFEEMGIPHILHKPHNAGLLLRTLGEVLGKSGALGRVGSTGPRNASEPPWPVRIRNLLIEPS